MSEPLLVVEERRASKAQLISIDGNQYSVPPAFAQKKMRVRRHENHIELLEGDQVVDSIELVSGRGKGKVEDRHYPAHLRKAKRATNPLQARFEGLAPSAKAYLEGSSQGGPSHLP